METRRLRTLQQPSHVERLLETYVSRSGLLPEDAYQIRDAAALSASLRRLVTLATHTGRVWSCWMNSKESWLFTGELSLDQSRERTRPVLLINRYNETADLQDAGAWMSDPEGGWQRLP